MSVAISAAGTGWVIRYPDLQCSGTLALDSQSEQRAEFAETITEGQALCGLGGHISLDVTGDDAIAFQRAALKGAAPDFTGTLQFSPASEPPDAQDGADPMAAQRVVDPLEGRDLARAIQTELARIGCDPGAADGLWGRNSARALERYAKAKDHPLPGPDMDLLQALANETGTICSLECSAKQTMFAGACVDTTCPPGQILTDAGNCVVRKAPVKKQKSCFVFNGKRVCN